MGREALASLADSSTAGRSCNMSTGSYQAARTLGACRGCAASRHESRTGWLAGRYALVDAATGAVKEMFSAGKAEAACHVGLSRSELLAVKDSSGLLVGSDGAAKQKAGGC